jgi:probable rRNA maturation factor
MITNVALYLQTGLRFSKMIQPNKRVFFHIPKPGAYFANRNLVRKLIVGIFRSEETALDRVDIILTSDKALLKINKRFLKHAYYTDVITFNLSELSGRVQGEIYISIDRTRENAGIYGLTLRSELCRVIIHGVLHLCGYGDRTNKEKEEMERKEDIYLSRLERMIPVPRRTVSR